MHNLIAYIPVLNRQYVEWLKGHQPFSLYLICQCIAEQLVPRLGRNLGALPARDIAVMINALGLAGEVRVLCDVPCPAMHVIFMPDDDVSHEYARHRLRYDPLYMSLTYEPVWGRWDMTAVKRQEPVLPDMEVSSNETDLLKMEIAQKLAQQSPDWWRQIGAFAFRGEKLIACACNLHFPTEYETFIFGDPRLNFDAGDPAGFDVYLSLHAEEGIVEACAKYGVALRGASVFVTTFPCARCARMLAKCEIKELFFQDGYSVLKGYEALKAACVRIVKIKSPESA